MQSSMIDSRPIDPAQPAASQPGVDADGALGAAQFRALLTQAELTQREFAVLAGVSSNSVSRWCSKSAVDRRPPARHAIALLYAYLLLDQGARVELVEQLNQLAGAEGAEGCGPICGRFSLLDCTPHRVRIGND